MLDTHTIVALSTPQGTGAIGVIRLSGAEAFAITDKVFRGKKLSDQPSHTIHYGHIVDGPQTIDEVMVALFRAPKSFTTENVVEISCHGSPFIIEQIIRLLISAGARAAKPGEFTLRAFLHGRIDLSQAEAVADLIASQSAAAHDIAIQQMRGGFAKQIRALRQELIDFAALIELELDFSEEDVEFANREKLLALLQQTEQVILPLAESFKLGNVIKQGVNTAIVGKPNAGKSTLLNTLLNEDRAIVSAIPGTTRDTIEETININGIIFRFIDTAGLRETTDEIEQIGVNKSYTTIEQASVLLYLTDGSQLQTIEQFHQEIIAANTFNTPHLLVVNKADLLQPDLAHIITQTANTLLISAKNKTGITALREALYQLVAGSHRLEDQTIVTNLRHYQSLQNALLALRDTKAAINNQISTELAALDLRRALEALGEISGDVTNDEILGSIFSKFCIGK
jgi:tRNA modification GTPase